MPLQPETVWRALSERGGRDYRTRSSTSGRRRVEDAVGALQRHGEGARLLAGGHSLIPMMKLRLAAPEVLVDIGGISKLRGVSETPDGIAIGALTRHDEVASSEIVRRGCPVLAESAGGIGDRQVRARGTIGGAIAQADPHGDLPAVLLALDGSVEVQGPNGGRTIAAADLFRGFLTTALEPGEMLTVVRVPTGVSRRLRQVQPAGPGLGDRRRVRGARRRVRADRDHRRRPAAGAGDRRRAGVHRLERRRGGGAGGGGSHPDRRRRRARPSIAGTWSRCSQNAPWRPRPKDRERAWGMR